ncbi:Lactonase, 7-bladed beta-propeller domain containing protein [Amanita muscaria]
MKQAREHLNVLFVLTRSDARMTYLVLSGSFRSFSLFLLAFDPLNRTLSLVQHVPGFGPHQYLATNAAKDRVYTTTWTQPPSLQSWRVDTGSVEHINTTPIRATSSYISIPAPHTHVYSTGGPTGEVHVVDEQTGGFREKIQEILFVPAELPTADKTRKALRYGSHAIEFSPSLNLAFVPVLGTNSIETYFHDHSTGLLTHLESTPSPRGPSAHDGPRHIRVHPNDRLLYCVTEHSNYVDIYSLSSSSPYLTFHSSRSIVPLHLSGTSFRGDTLVLSPSLGALFTTTRGPTPATQGWLSVFALDNDGFFTSEDGERYQTPTSGGKAHAIDLLAKSPSTNNSLPVLPYPLDMAFQQQPLLPSTEEAVWILLTDDDDSTLINGGGVRVLEWNGWGTGGFKEVVKWPLPSEAETMSGGSHAIWL